MVGGGVVSSCLMKTTPDGKIRCPKDATIMERMSVGSGDLVVDHCGRCGAIWFDAYELDAVLKAKDKGIDLGDIDYGAAGHGYEYKVLRDDFLECPRDHTKLVQVPDPRQPHVVIDICRTCGGVLLDSGELKDLSEFTLGERVKSFFRLKKE